MLLLFYAGAMWMTAAGSEERVGKAKKIIKMAVIGLVIVAFAYFVVSFIVDLLISSQTPPAGGAGGAT